MNLLRFFGLWASLTAAGCGVMGNPVPYVDSHPKADKPTEAPAGEKAE